MASSFMSQVLLRVLRAYIRDADGAAASDLRLSLSGGSLTLRNFELNLPVPRHIPLTVRRARVASLHLSIPWAALGTGSSGSSGSRGGEAAHAREEVEELMALGGVWSFLQATLLNASVTVTNVHLKYMTPSAVVSLGWSQLDLFSAADDWTKAFVPPEEGVRKVLEVNGLSVDVASASSQSQNITYRANQVPLLPSVCLTSRLAITPPCPALSLPQRACLSLRLLPLALSARPSQLSALLSAVGRSREVWGGSVEAEGAGAGEVGDEAGVGAGGVAGRSMGEKAREVEEGNALVDGGGGREDAHGGTSEAAEKLLVGEQGQRERGAGAREKAERVVDEGREGGQVQLEEPKQVDEAQQVHVKRGVLHSMGRAIGWVQSLFADEDEDEESAGHGMAAVGRGEASVRAAASGGGRDVRGAEGSEIWEWGTGYEAGVHFDVAATDWSVAVLLEGAELALVSKCNGGSRGGASSCPTGDAGSAEDGQDAPALPRPDTAHPSPPFRPNLVCRLGAVLVESEGRGTTVEAASVKLGPLAVSVAVPGGSSSGVPSGVGVGSGASDAGAAEPSPLLPLLQLHTRQQAGQVGAAAAGGPADSSVGSFDCLQAAGPLGLTADVSLSLHVGHVAVSYWPGMASSVVQWWQEVEALGGGEGMGGDVRRAGWARQEESIVSGKAPSASVPASTASHASPQSSPSPNRWLASLTCVSSAEVVVDGVAVRVRAGSAGDSVTRAGSSDIEGRRERIGGASVGVSTGRVAVSALLCFSSRPLSVRTARGPRPLPCHTLLWHQQHQQPPSASHQQHQVEQQKQPLCHVHLSQVLLEWQGVLGGAL
ncbi:hypothetical protein CLOM_g4817 [Closterium sp. NIES-68]|nr:hypothetical protein CLOM_g4817 [Closterium sp. NIES-68]